MNHLEKFQTVDSQLIEARKAVQERNRLLDVMATVDEELHQLRLKQANLEAQGLADLLAEDYSQVVERIAVLERRIEEWEETLVALAECDEAYDRLRHEQEMLIWKLEVREVKRLRKIPQMIALKQETVEMIEKGIRHGEKVLAKLELMLDGLQSHSQIGETEYRLSTAVTHALELIPLLEQFAQSLSEMQENFWLKPQFFLSGDYITLPASQFSFMYFVLQITATQDGHDRVRLWRHQLQHFVSHVQYKVSSLAKKVSQLENEMTTLGREKEQLIAQLWQAHYFTMPVVVVV